ncbi:MAG: hypothetical protein OEV22_12965 [Deltaproteobacteria bacterium]|nr:hypothetical protein [Deltaproteobacteria bacterium]
MKLYHEQRGYHNKKAEPGIPHLLSLNQDIVARSQEQKCGLKYVIHSQTKNPSKLLARPNAAVGGNDDKF